MRIWGAAALLAVGVNPPVLSFPATAYQYDDPVVFQRANRDVAGNVGLRSKLWIMEADGNFLRQLTFGDAYDDHPSVYGDRTHILFAEFSRNALDPRAHSRLMSLNIYTGARKVIEEIEDCSVHHATLSPIDDRIAYHRDCVGRSSHWVGTGVTAREISTIVTDGVWSGAGLIASYDFGNRQPGGKALVELQRVDGKVQARVIMKGKGHGNPVAVSPDGQWLAWDEVLADGDPDVFLGRIDGTNIRNVTAATGNDSHPWFSRDGRWLSITRIDPDTSRSGGWNLRRSVRNS
jgi:hypothetical protein